MKLICAAMPHELSYAQGTLNNFSVEYIDDISQTCLLHSLRTKNTYLGAVIGIGPIYIEECLDELARKFYISDVVLVGIAGTATQNIAIHDVVVGKMCYLLKQQQVIAAQCTETSRKDITAMLSARNYNPIVGDFVSLQREMLSESDCPLHCLRSQQDAVIAVDMEAGVVGRWAKVRGISYSVVKVISDSLPISKPQDLPRKEIIKKPQFLQSLRYSQQISNEILDYFDSS